MKVAAARWATCEPTSLEPVKLMARTSGCSTRALPTAAAAAADDVDDARGQACIDQGLHEVVDGERRVGRGLDDAGVAADERGKELPTGDGHGEVPRRDEADDANGHADAHGELVLELGGRGLAEEAAAFAGDIEGFVDGFLHVAASFGEHLAHFAGHVARVLFLALLQQDAGADEDFGALGRGDEAPGGEGFFGGGDGGIHVFRAGGWKGADDVVVVGGVDVEDGFAACGGEPFAADQIVVGGVGHGQVSGFRGQGS